MNVSGRNCWPLKKASESKRNNSRGWRIAPDGAGQSFFAVSRRDVSLQHRRYLGPTVFAGDRGLRIRRGSVHRIGATFGASHGRESELSVGDAHLSASRVAGSAKRSGRRVFYFGGPS